jgi:hypothetical protein
MVAGRRRGDLRAACFGANCKADYALIMQLAGPFVIGLSPASLRTYLTFNELRLATAPIMLLAWFLQSSHGDRWRDQVLEILFEEPGMIVLYGSGKDIADDYII